MSQECSAPLLDSDGSYVVWKKGDVPQPKRAKVNSKTDTATQHLTEEERKARIEKAFNYDPESVFVIEPARDNWMDNSAYVAGYLGFSGNLEVFRQLPLGQWRSG